MQFTSIAIDMHSLQMVTTWAETMDNEINISWCSIQ